MASVIYSKEYYVPTQRIAELLAQYSEHIPELLFSETGSINWKWNDDVPEDEDELTEMAKDEANQIIQDSYD